MSSAARNPLLNYARTVATVTDTDRLCLQCPLTDCDEAIAGCLRRQQRAAERRAAKAAKAASQPVTDLASVRARAQARWQEAS